MHAAVKCGWPWPFRSAPLLRARLAAGDVMAGDDEQGKAGADKWRIDTLLTHTGLSPHDFHGFINPPVVRASTVLFPDVDAMLGRTGHRYSYGLTNTPTIEALVDAFTALDGAAGTVLVPSGLAAVPPAVVVAVRPGTRILVPDTVYAPTRRFCDESLPAFGVETIYYDPLIGGDIAGLLANASALFLEAPGSHSFEMPD